MQHGFGEMMVSWFTEVVSNVTYAGVHNGTRLSIYGHIANPIAASCLPPAR